MIGDPYISRAEMKGILGITSSEEDTLIDRAIRGASQSINRKSGYSTFWNTGTAVTRTIEVHRRILPMPYGKYKLLLPDGIANTTGLLVGGSYAPRLIFPTRGGDPATELELSSLPTTSTIDVTAVWGWDQVPDDIIMATQFQAHRYYKRRGSPEGLAGSAEWGIVRVPRLDADVAAILKNGGYMNPGVG